MQSPITDALINAASGTIGGIISYSTFYPLENFRTRLQCRAQTTQQLLNTLLNDSDNKTPSNNHSKRPRLSHAQKMIHALSFNSQVTTAETLTVTQAILNQLKLFYYQFLDTLQFAQEIYQTQGGIKGFFGGLTAGIWGIGISNAVYMYWYQLLKDFALKLRKIQRYIMRRNKLPPTTPHTPSVLHQQTLGALDNILVASLAGVINITITNPVWVVNTRMMMQSKTSSLVEQTNKLQTTIVDYCSSFLASQESSTDKAPKTNTFVSFQELLHYYATKYSVKAFDALFDVYDALNSRIRLLLEMFLKIPSSTSSTQSDTINDPYYYTSLFDGIYKTLKYEGFSGLYKGYAASLVLILNPTIQYVVYDQIIDFLIRKRSTFEKPVHDSPVTSLEYFLVAACTKALATVLTFPYQVVKARQQQQEKITAEAVNLDAIKHDIVDATQEFIQDLQEKKINEETRASFNSVNVKNMSLYQTMLHMYQTEGPAVFFTGLLPKLIQTVSNAALTTLLHERIKQYIVARMGTSKRK